jgi:hypothetical protein
MKITSEYVDLISSLAQEVEAEDPIDWGLLAIDEDEAYRIMTISVLEMMADKYDQPNMKDVLLATIVKLVVENFTLNLKMREK